LCGGYGVYGTHKAGHVTYLLWSGGIFWTKERQGTHNDNLVVYNFPKEFTKYIWIIK